MCVDGTIRLRHRGAELLLKPGRAALCSTVNPLEARNSTQNRLLGATIAVEGVGELLMQHILATMSPLSTPPLQR